jgi:hypothetical protein
LLKTDRTDLSADEAWRIYTLLTRAEAAFQTLKSPLGERPIFHHKEGRVEAHIFLCVLAYPLLISIEKTLLDAGVHTSWATVRETVKTHQVSTVVLPTDGGVVLRIRRDSTPEGWHAQRTHVGADDRATAHHRRLRNAQAVAHRSRGSTGVLWRSTHGATREPAAC